jgi:hypothetical protein
VRIRFAILSLHRRCHTGAAHAEYRSGLILQAVTPHRPFFIVGNAAIGNVVLMALFSLCGGSGNPVVRTVDFPKGGDVNFGRGPGIRPENLRSITTRPTGAASGFS